MIYGNIISAVQYLNNKLKQKSPLTIEDKDKMIEKMTVLNDFMKEIVEKYHNEQY